MTEEAKRKCDVPGCDAYVYISRWAEHHALIHQPQSTDYPVYWSDHFQALNKGVQEKAQEFIELRLIEYSGSGAYVCRPLPKNHRVHVMRKDPETREFTCTCQGYHANGTCSHIGGLYRYFAMGQRYER